MQIDWISAITATPPELWPGYTSGQRLKVDPDGQIVENKPSMHQVEDSDPSSSRNFTVWTPNPGTLYLSGNPVKLLQGHNLWGSLDVYGLYFEAGAFIRKHAGLFPGPRTWESCRFTSPRFTRLDLTRSYRFASQPDADDYIRYIAGNARSRHGAATLVGGTTAYFGQHSRRWTLKVYAKWHEIVNELRKHARSPFTRRGHALPAELADWARGVVRFEFTLRTPELDDFPPGRLASPDALRSLWQDYFDRITMTENSAMNTSSPLIEAELPGRLQGVLAVWRSGRDPRAVYARPTFYRYRAELIQRLGIDINVPPAPDAPATVRAVLDPAGWDPEPIQARTVDPRPALKAQYRLV